MLILTLLRNRVYIARSAISRALSIIVTMNVVAISVDAGDSFHRLRMKDVACVNPRQLSALFDEEEFLDLCENAIERPGKATDSGELSKLAKELIRSYETEKPELEGIASRLRGGIRGIEFDLAVDKLARSHVRAIYGYLFQAMLWLRDGNLQEAERRITDASAVFDHLDLEYQPVVKHYASLSYPRSFSESAREYLVELPLKILRWRVTCSCQKKGRSDDSESLPSFANRHLDSEIAIDQQIRWRAFRGLMKIAIENGYQEAIIAQAFLLPDALLKAHGSCGLRRDDAAKHSPETNALWDTDACQFVDVDLNGETSDAEYRWFIRKSFAVPEDTAIIAFYATLNCIARSYWNWLSNSVVEKTDNSAANSLSINQCGVESLDRLFFPQSRFDVSSLTREDAAEMITNIAMAEAAFGEAVVHFHATIDPQRARNEIIQNIETYANSLERIKTLQVVGGKEEWLAEYENRVRLIRGRLEKLSPTMKLAVNEGLQE